MERARSGRPSQGEFAGYAAADIGYVEGDDAISALAAQARLIEQFYQPLSDGDAGGVRYAPGKWTVKEILGHLIDDERIFVYRILTVARHDPLVIPGFDENLYVATAGFEPRPLADLLAEYRATRAATLAFLSGLSREAWDRRGVVNGYEASVRGLAFHVAGHELHHLRVLRERYLPLLPRP